MTQGAFPPRRFEFWGCSEIRESLGITAESERHLMERLETVPPESIYYHTVRALLRRQVVPTPYPDDFASWVATEVRDPVLAERLALSSPFDFADTEAFREHLLGILDDHLSRLPFTPAVVQGSPFYFLRGHLAAVPLGVEAVDLAGLGRSLSEVDDSSIYYHAVEAIGRLGRVRSDFATWVDDGLALPGLAVRMDEIDPFVASLGGVRQQLLTLVREALEGRS
ncbi:MAG: hypothetical protein HY317_01585 [Acidobacteria bacterium]|nr:hypothetical protein [Acidobacteriota bacterium]